MVLMRGHGATIVGRSVSQAVLFAVYAVINARALAQSLSAGGKPTYLNAAEGRNIANILQDGSRTWDYLSRLATAAVLKDDLEQITQDHRATLGIFAEPALG